MPVNIKVIDPKEFIKTTVTGVFDLAASKQALVDIASLIKQPGEYEVLIDTRAADVELSITNLFQIGVALADHPLLSRSKIGLLAPMSEVDNARFLETVAITRGVRIKAFNNFEDAITWLVLREQK